MTSILKKTSLYGLCLPFLLALATTSAFTPAVLSAPAGEEVNLRVARLSYMEGDISIKRIDDKDWAEGMLNVPLMAGDQVYVGLGGRAEMQFEDGITLYIDSDTYIYFAFLDDGLQQVEVRQGTLGVTAENAEYNRPPLEIKSTYFSATVMDYSKARFDVDADGPATIQVDRGEIRVYRDKQSHYKVRADEMLIVRDPDPETYSITEDRADDSFDRWTDLRDALNISTTSSRYVTSRVVGHRDLDAYGDWVDVREYGRVWRPRVITANWAPYRHGRWFWRPHYGWCWVSDEPWGWTPYHYGRWVHVRNYDWCWVPSDVHYHSGYSYYRYNRPVWYPALVSFTYARRGSYFNFSTGGGYGGGYYDGGAIGWFPLGPRDPYSGWYHHRLAYVDRSYRSYNFGNTYIDNSVNVTNVTNIYQNQYVNNAITVVPRDQFHAVQPERIAVATLPENQPINNGGEVQVGNNALPEVPNIGADAPRLPRISAPRNAEPVVTPSVATAAPSVGGARAAGGQEARSELTAAAPNSILPQVEAPRVSAGRSPRNTERSANQPVSTPEPATPNIASERSAQSQAPRGSEVTAQPSTDQGPTLSAPRSSEGRSPRSDTASDASAAAPSASTRSERAVSESRDTSPRRGEGPAASDGVTASPRTESSRSERPTSSGRTASPTVGEQADRTESGLPSISSPRSSGNGSDRSASPRSERPTSSTRDSSPRRSESSSRSESTPGASGDLPQARERAESPRTERPTSSPRGNVESRSERSSDSGSPSVSPRSERGSTPSRDLSMPRSTSRNGEAAAPSVIRPQRSESSESPRTSRPTSGVRGSSSSRDSSRLVPESSSRSELPSSPSASPRRSEAAPRSVERPESSVPRTSPRSIERSESAPRTAPRSVIMGDEGSRASRESAPRVIEPRRSESRSEDRTVFTAPRFQRSERSSSPSFAPQSSAPSFSMPRMESSRRSESFGGGSGFRAPQFSAPRMESRPSFESRSSAPSFSAPSFSAPRAPSFNMPESRAAMPSAPSMSMPSVSSPRGSVSAPQSGGPAFSNPRGNSPAR